MLPRKQDAPVELTKRLSTLVGESATSRLVTHYRGSTRFYHNLEHLKQGVRDYYNLIAAPLTNVNFLAWAYHDVVYDPRASDNEQQSAAYFMQDARGAGIGYDVCDEVASLIMATTHAGSTISIVNDMDLTILGKSKEAYQAYAQAIRQEYSFVPDDAFREGRKRILQSLLNRPWIYNNGNFREEFELPARYNMEDEIKTLST
jgi:predicted metal-dependent HD superfamily phosphohydrolase